MADTEVQKLIIWVGTQEKITDARNQGLITNDDFAVVTDAPEYAKLSDVGNAILTVQKNGTDIGTFTANSKTDETINITVPTKTSDLSNDSGFITISALSGYATQQWVNQQGFLTSSSLSGYATETWVVNQGYITGITSSDVTAALGYTPYDSNNPNGYTSNVGTVTSVNNVSPTNGNVTLSIPSDTSDLTNGAGYITSSALSGYQTTSNLVTSVSSASTDDQYPSAKLFYDTCGDIETLINAL